jgi:uncharacterized metal-binding protein
MAGCSCGGDCSSALIYSCSGAANTGLLADQTMRALNKEKAGNSSCLAAIGAGLSGFLESAKASGCSIVLDGCKVACGKTIFEKNGLPFRHFIMTDFGVEKGKTAITEEIIAATTRKVVEELKK